MLHFIPNISDMCSIAKRMVYELARNIFQNIQITTNMLTKVSACVHRMGGGEKSETKLHTEYNLGKVRVTLYEQCIECPDIQLSYRSHRSDDMGTLDWSSHASSTSLTR